MQRRAGTWLAMSGVVAIAGSAALIIGFRQWYVIASVVLSYGFLLIWMNYYFRSDTAFKSMPDPKIIVSITDDWIEFMSSEHESKLKWNRITEVWTFPDVWLLFIYSEDFLTPIPAEALDDASAAFIKKRVVDSGGKVT